MKNLPLALALVFSAVNFAGLIGGAAYVNHYYTDAATATATIDNLEGQLRDLRTADTDAVTTMNELDSRVTAIEGPISTVDLRITAAITAIPVPNFVDSDGDKVPEPFDRCNGSTAAEIEAGIIGADHVAGASWTDDAGCGDSDNDGTINGKDKCSDTVADAWTNPNGCSEEQILGACSTGKSALVKDAPTKVTLTGCSLAAPDEVLTCDYDKASKTPYSACDSSLAG